MANRIWFCYFPFKEYLDFPREERKAEKKKNYMGFQVSEIKLGDIRWQQTNIPRSYEVNPSLRKGH